MKKILLVLSIILFSQSVFANQHNRVAVVPPVVVKVAEPGLKPISLSELNINAEVISNIATSTYELVFHNPNNRVLEGELVFSLFDGQSVIDYALQINGKYRHASVVPKAKAKEAFENIIRAGIDPGLIEKTIGNNFKTRLYPIPANGFKRIKITVQEILESSNNRFQYRIPFINKQPLKKLKIAINLPSLTTKPQSNYAGMIFDKVSQGQLVKLEKANALIKQPIIIDIDSKNQQRAFIKKMGGGDYVYTSLEHKTNTKFMPRKLPRNIAIIWNHSLSNQDRDLNKEFQFLNKYIQKAGLIKVQLISLSNYAHLQKPITICAQNANCPNGKRFSYLRNQLNKLRFDGTSDYSKLNFNQLQVDEILMFSNGIRTIFNKDLASINKPVTTINSSLKADTDLLKVIAKNSNGRFIDMSKTNAYEGFQKFQRNANRVKVIGSSNNIKGQNIFTTLENNRLNVFVRTNPNFTNGWIQLEITQQGRKVQKAIKLVNLIPVKQSLNSLWATQKINDLAFNYRKNKKTIINLAKNHKVLTKDTSLIVLDRVEDYVRYEIIPPHELRQQYAKLLKKKVNKKLYEKEQALIESIQLLQKQRVWFNKKFPKTPPPPKPDTQKIANVTARQTPMANVELAAPAPAPRMAAPQAKRKAEAKAKSQIARKPTVEIKLKSFNPNAVYIKQIKAQKQANWLHTYFSLKRQYLKQPMFYVDVADLFYKNKQKKEAIIILSNLLELDFENSEFLRVFALKAMELGEYKLAIKAFEKVKELRPFEPQSFRDLALAYNKNRQHQKAANMLYSILVHTWDGRFDGIKIVIINEFNNILSLHKNVDRSKFDRRLINHIPVDLRIVINWSSDNTDIDLWVIDPYKEKTYYSNKISRIGGKISNDITQGYGPEEFMIRDAVSGVYKIQANYYGNTQQKKLIPVTIRAEVYSAYSQKDEVQKEIVLRLKDKKAVIDIGEYRYEK